MDLRLTPEQEALRKEFDDFFREEMKNAPKGWQGGLEAMYGSEEGWAFHKSVAKKLGEKGWLALAWPKKYGGMERPIVEQMLFSEVVGHHDAPGVEVFGISMIAPVLLAAASEEQKQEYLPPIAKNEVNWCQLWSEPNAGSDLAALTTTAVKDGDEYVLNGQKIWTSGAHRADWGFGIFRTDATQKRSKGLSCIVVDMKTPGIEVRPLVDMAKNHVFNEVFFDNVRVPVKNRVGEENQGWMVTRMMMNFERSSIGSFAIQKRLLEQLVRFCKETTWNGRPLADNVLTRHRLAQIAIEIETGFAMAHRVAWTQHKMNLGQSTVEDLIALSSGAKVWSTEQMQRAASSAMNILGLYGQVKGASEKWARIDGFYESEFQACLGYNLGGGTSEIQRNLVAWTKLGLPRT
jgi:alkylation response protein AidB-like acyl-CoA dehydrogenase